MQTIPGIDTSASSMRTGTVSGQLGILLADTLEAMEAKIIKRGRHAVSTSGPIDPQVAVQLWCELAAISNLRHALSGNVKKGRAASTKLEQQMEN